MARNDAVLESFMALIRSALLIIFACGLARAEGAYKFKKRVTPHLLQQQLVAAGYNVSPELGIACSDDNCAIYWGAGGEAKDPRSVIDAHVYQDRSALGAQEREALKALALKWKAGTITILEKEDLLKRLVLLLLGL